MFGKEKKETIEVIKLGQKGRDKVTGFEGIIAGHADYLYGCDQYMLTPKSTDGKAAESCWFDDGRIEVISEGIDPESVKAKKNGGPNFEAPRCK